MLNKKYESITGQELPVKIKTDKKIIKIKTWQGMTNILKHSEFIGEGWGRAVNNHCEIRQFKNGVEIECYYSFGNLMTVFIIK